MEQGKTITTESKPENPAIPQILHRAERVVEDARKGFIQTGRTTAIKMVTLGTVIAIMALGCTSPAQAPARIDNLPTATAVVSEGSSAWSAKKDRHKQFLEGNLLNGQYFTKHSLQGWFEGDFPGGSYERSYFYEYPDQGGLWGDYTIYSNENGLSRLEKWNASLSLPLLTKDEDPSKLNKFLQDHPEISSYLKVRKFKPEERYSNSQGDYRLVITDGEQKNYVEALLNIPGLEFRPQQNEGSVLLPNGNKVRVRVGDDDIQVAEITPAAWQRDDINYAIYDYFNWVRAEKDIPKMPNDRTDPFRGLLYSTAIIRDPNSTDHEVLWEMKGLLNEGNVIHVVAKYGTNMELLGMTFTGILGNRNDIEGARIEDKAYETFRVGTELSRKEWRKEDPQGDEHSPQSLNFYIFPAEEAKMKAAQLSIGSNRHWQLDVSGTKQN